MLIMFSSLHGAVENIDKFSVTPPLRCEKTHCKKARRGSAGRFSLAFVRFSFYTVVISSGRDAEARALDGLGDGGHVGPGGETHLAALEVDGKRRSAGTGRGARDGLYAAVAVHAGDLEDEFLSHVI